MSSRPLKKYGTLERNKRRRYNVTLNVFENEHGQYPYYQIDTENLVKKKGDDKEEWLPHKYSKWYYTCDKCKHKGIAYHKIFSRITIPVRLLKEFIEFLSSFDVEEDDRVVGMIQDDEQPIKETNGDPF